MRRLAACLAVLSSASLTHGAEPSVDDLRLRVASLFSGEGSGAAGATDAPAVSLPVATSAVVKFPHLIATVADRGCGPCDDWEREELPRLQKAGWRVEVNRVPFGSAETPAFELRSGKRWIGYSGVAAFESRIAPPAPAVGASGAAHRQIVLVPPPPAVVSRAVPPARQRWSYNGGGSLADHLRRTHGIDPSGMSHADMVNAHSHAHEGTWGRVRSAQAVRYAQPAVRYVRPVVMRSGCPGGRCP